MEKTTVTRTSYMQSLLNKTYSGVAVQAITQGKLEGSWEKLIADAIRKDYINDHSEACEIIETVSGPGLSARDVYLKAAYLITSSKPPVCRTSPMP